MIAEVQADLNKVVQMEARSGNELSTHLMLCLFYKVTYNNWIILIQDRPLLKYRFGLYHGNEIREKLKTEYLKGIQKIILQPTQQNMAQYFAE